MIQNVSYFTFKSQITNPKKKRETSLHPKLTINISSYHKKLPGVIASEIDDIVQSPCPDMIKSTPWKTVSLLFYPPPHVRTKHQHINIFTTLVDSSPRHHPSLSIPFSSSTKKPTFIEQRGGRKLVSLLLEKKILSLSSGGKNRNVIFWVE